MARSPRGGSAWISREAFSRLTKSVSSPGAESSISSRSRSAASRYMARFMGTLAPLASSSADRFSPRVTSSACAAWRSASPERNVPSSRRTKRFFWR